MANQSLTPEQETTIREYLLAPPTYRTSNTQSWRRPKEAKIILLGPSGIGLSALEFRLSGADRVEPYDPTYDGSCRRLITIQEISVVVEFESFAMPDAYVCAHLVKHGDAVFLVYSVADRESFDMAGTFYQDLCTAVQRMNPEEVAPTAAGAPHRLKIPVWVVANKTDLPAESWRVTAQEGEELSRKVGGRFMSVSTKTDDGFEEGQLQDIVSWVLLAKIANQATSVAPAPTGERPKTRPRMRPRERKRSRWSLHRLSDKVKKMFSIRHK